MNIKVDISNVVLKTQRLTLRSFRYEDLDDFYDYAKVEGVGELAGGKHHQNKEETLKILEMFINNKNVFAIEINNHVYGSFGLEKYNKEDELTEFSNYYGIELGFVLAKQFWGQGIIKEACDAVIDYLFNVLNIDFILCCHFERNNQSKRVQEKCGFIPYRKLIFDTSYNTKEPSIMNLLLNPKKDIKLDYSHQETLIIK